MNNENINNWNRFPTVLICLMYRWCYTDDDCLYRRIPPPVVTMGDHLLSRHYTKVWKKWKSFRNIITFRSNRKFRYYHHFCTHPPTDLPGIGHKDRSDTRSDRQSYPTGDRPNKYLAHERSTTRPLDSKRIIGKLTSPVVAQRVCFYSEYDIMILLL